MWVELSEYDWIPCLVTGGVGEEGRKGGEGYIYLLSNVYGGSDNSRFRHILAVSFLRCIQPDQKTSPISQTQSQRLLYIKYLLLHLRVLSDLLSINHEWFHFIFTLNASFGLIF